jgi:hypothetical protein
MVLVAVSAVLAWVARDREGRLWLYLAVLVVGGAAAGMGISSVIDWIFNDDRGPDREG